MNTVHVNFRIPEDQDIAIKRLVREDRTASDVHREALEIGLKKLERDDWIEEATNGMAKL